MKLVLEIELAGKDELGHSIPLSLIVPNGPLHDNALDALGSDEFDRARVVGMRTRLELGLPDEGRPEGRVATKAENSWEQHWNVTLHATMGSLKGCGLSLHVCGLCSAAVIEDFKDEHDRWHDSLNDEEE
jgi:hypothetical protein